MKFLSILSLAGAALAAPLAPRQAALTDADILNFALTLEHLENVFYKGVLDKFTKQDFLNAGYSGAYYTNLEYIAHDEESHVELLTSALSAAGATPVAACSYSFPYTDIKSFITLSTLLEGVGTSAYLGAAPAVQSKAYLAVAGSILVTEAIHTSLQRFTGGLVAPVNAYGTALGVNEVYTLAAAFITGCPASNPALPVTAFPALAASTAPGYIYYRPAQACFSTNATLPSGQLYATFISGLDITSVPATVSGSSITVDIPATADGQTYVVITNANVTTLADSAVVAGPAIIEVGAPYPTRNDSIQRIK